MRRGVLFLLLCASAARIEAQQWNDPRVLALVRQATDRRAEQLADSGLVDYQATAHGYVTFLAQLGEGFREPPQVVKADELALQVYWRAPNLSKQRIVGRRDTTLLPTDIQYHRDHLGIVQNNFPAIIRLGEGDEVRDVPHPLSPLGLQIYDFALSDSLRIVIPGREIGVYEVKVRPKDDRLPRVIGALYLDRSSGQVVRMALSFTRAAFLDKQLEDVFIVLENGLVGATFWLPRRQEIEIRRTATWMDYPVRGIIRGRWEIGEYQLNTGIPLAQFAGPEIVQSPASVLKAYRFPGARILDSLPPDVRAPTAAEIRRVQDEARTLVREQALRRARGATIAGRGLSDFARFNRVEGVALGAGLKGRFGGGFEATAAGRYGIANEGANGRVELLWKNAHGSSASIYAAREYRDVGDVAERSLLVNSLAAQEFASDYTDLFQTDAAGVTFGVTGGGLTWTLDLSRERQDLLATHAVPASGRFVPPIPADSTDVWRAQLIAEQPTRTLGDFEIAGRGGVRVVSVPAFAGFCIPTATCGATRVARVFGDLEIELPIKDVRIVSRTIGSLARGTDNLPAQELIYFGGPVTAPGYDYHSLVGEAVISQRLEVRFPVPFVPIPLGRFGRSAASAKLAPFVVATGLDTPDEVSVGSLGNPRAVDRLFGRESGFYPSAGVGVLLFFDLLRVDVARGLNNGRWSFYFDVSRTFWKIL